MLFVALCSIIVIGSLLVFLDDDSDEYLHLKQDVQEER